MDHAQKLGSQKSANVKLKIREYFYVLTFILSGWLKAELTMSLRLADSSSTSRSWIEMVKSKIDYKKYT